MPALSSAQQNAAASLARDLEEVFGSRLRALVAYPGTHGDGSVHSCAIVDDLSFDDLSRCLPFTASWHQRRVAAPLMLSATELQRTIDIFPLEYAAIIADHTVVRGEDPFAGISIPAEDVRRATEAQAKSHLIHLREGYLESHGETRRVSHVIAASAAPLRALLINIARLEDPVVAAPSDDALARMAEMKMDVEAAVIREVLASSLNGQSTITDPSHLFARYVQATQKIWEYVDVWRA
jgi:hypothetical protein